MQFVKKIVFKRVVRSEYYTLLFRQFDTISSTKYFLNILYLQNYRNVDYRNGHYDNFVYLHKSLDDAKV